MRELVGTIASLTQFGFTDRFHLGGIMNKKDILATALCGIAVGVMPLGDALAASGYATAPLQYIIKHDEGVYPQYPYIGIGLTNTAGQGTCGTYDNVAYFAVHDKDQKAMAVAAYLAGRQVEIAWDDT